MTATSIQWTDATWNPTRGCSRVSEGCRNCYAERIASRFSGPGEAFDGFAFHVPAPGWTGRVELILEKLDEPLHWKKPRRVFVNSMSDLFHEKLSDEAIDKVFAVMALAQRHTFQVLTKRPDRMRDYLARLVRSINPLESVARRLGYSFLFDGFDGKNHTVLPWPIPNVWLGVSVEDQKTADEREAILREVPAAIRFISQEPQLGPIHRKSLDGIGWLIIGGESGPGARPFDLAWACRTVEACKAVGVPVFVKQLGAHVIDCDYAGEPFRVRLDDHKGGDPSEWPDDLRVRDFPR